MNNRAIIYNADCFDIFPTIPTESIDMVLCDLPYGTTICKWDTVLDLTSLFKEYKRILKKNSALVLFAAQPFTSRLVMTEPESFKYDWTWIKSKATNHLNVKKQPLRNKEDILVFSFGKTPYYPQYSSGLPYKGNGKTKHPDGTYNKHGEFRNDNPGIRHPRQTLEFPSLGTSNVLHPTQKPVELLEYLIKTYTLENETVLDNTMGSGSTGIACLNSNRKFIGIEIDTLYFDRATKRINEHTVSLNKETPTNIWDELFDEK